MKKWKVLAMAAVVSAGLTAIAHSARAQNITAAGATFPDPVYERWFKSYKNAHPGVQINYQAIGSGGGIKQLTEGTID